MYVPKLSASDPIRNRAIYRVMMEVEVISVFDLEVRGAKQTIVPDSCCESASACIILTSSLPIGKDPPTNRLTKNIVLIFKILNCNVPTCVGRYANSTLTPPPASNHGFRVDAGLALCATRTDYALFSASNYFVVARARARAQRRRALLGGNAPHCIRTHAQNAALQHRIVAVAGARRHSIEYGIARTRGFSTISAFGRFQRRSGVVARSRTRVAPRQRDPAGVRIR